MKAVFGSRQLMAILGKKAQKPQTRSAIPEYKTHSFIVSIHAPTGVATYLDYHCRY
jgi:predicted ester cyclase